MRKKVTQNRLRHEHTSSNIEMKLKFLLNAERIDQFE